MPAPLVQTYSVSALVAAHTSFLNLIDAGAGNGSIVILSAADVVLAEVPLSGPGGTVNGGTGQLTLSISGPDPSSNASGTAAYAQIRDSDANVLLSLPAQSGSVAVPGVVVVNTLSVVALAPYSVISAIIG